MTLHKLLIRFLRLLFGDFNGVQVFLYPMTLFYWIDTQSFLNASISLFTIQKYIMPLAVFLIVFIYVAFLVLKNYSALFSSQLPHPEAEKTSFNLRVIGLHKLLLLVMVVLGLIYLLAEFLKHFYGIALPLKIIYLVLARLLSVLLILGYSLHNSWTRPYRQQGMSIQKADVLLRKDYRENQGPYLLHAAAHFLLAFIFSAVYNLIVLNLFYWIFQIIGVSPSLLFVSKSGYPSLFYNIWVLCAALMLSNLLFSPFVKLGVHISDKLHPQRFKAWLDAKHAETRQNV